MSTRVGSAHIDVTATTRAAQQSLQAFARQASTQLRALTTPRRVTVDVADARAQVAALRVRLGRDPIRMTLKIDDASLAPDLNAIRAKLQGLALQLQNLFKVDASTLTTLSATIGKQITELRAVEQGLKNLGSTSRGGNGGGTGGGSPGVPPGYSAQLRALQGDLRAGTLSTAGFEQATRALQATITSEIASLRALGPLTADQSRRLDGLRAASGQASEALRRVGTSAAGGIQKLGQDLATANSRFERGDLTLRAYLRELEQIKAASQGLASGLTAGSREAARLEQVMGGLSRSTRALNDQSITKIRADLAAARAEFERATVAAGRFGNTRTATQAYETQMRALEARIRAVGERTTTTAGQLRSLNQLSAQLGSQRNALQGGGTPLGLFGNVRNALQSVLPTVGQLSPSLGAAAGQLGAMAGGAAGLTAALGPVGIAIGVITVAVAALTAGLAASVRTAADFEQKLADIRALTQPTAAELGALTRAAFQIGQPLGVGARDAASAILELNKAGLSAKDVIGGGLKGALELAGAAGISTAEASTLATGALTAFGLQAQQLPRVADVFANFSNKTFLGAADLSQAIAAVGPVARSSGLNLQQFGGIMATLAQGGFKNMSDAGTSLKTMLLSLQAPSETGAAALKAIQTTVFDAAGNLKPFATTLSEIRTQLVKLTPEAQKRVLKDIFGTDAIRAAEILAREGPAAIDANTRAMGKIGEAARVARERMQSLQGAGKQFGAAFEELRIRVGTPFLAFLAGLVRAGTSVVTGLNGMIAAAQQGQGAFGSLATSSQQAMTALGGIVSTVFGAIKALWDAVLAPVLRALGAVWLVIQQAAVTALTLLLNVVNGVFQGVGAAITALLGNFGVGASGIRLSLAGIADAVVRGAGIARVALVALGRFAATLPDAFRLAGTGVGTVLAGLGRTIQGFGQGTRAVFIAAGGYAAAYAQAVGRTAQNIGLIVRGITGVFGALAQAVRTAIVERAGQVLAAGVRLYGVFADGVGRILGQLAGGFFRYVVQPVQAGANFLLQAYTRVSGIVAGAANRISAILAPIGTVLKALGLSIGDALAGVAKAALNRASGIVDAFAGSAQAAYTRAQAAAQQAATSSATSTANGVATALRGATTALTSFARDNGAGQALDTALGQVRSGMTGLSQNAGQLRSDFNAVAGTLTTEVASAAQTVASGLADVRTGAQLTGAALDLVQRGAQDAVQGFTSDVKTLGKTAAATATAIQAIRPPTVLASGTKTLADLGLDGSGTRSGGKTTAADVAALDEYKTGLRGYTAEQLAAAKAEAIRTNNKRHLTAILAEEARRQREATTEAKKAATQSRQSAADLARETAARTALVREIRQSIAAFALQDKQHKVTATSLLAFRQRLEDFQARVATLPPALRSGIQALFDQGVALANSAAAHVAHGRAVALSGVALTKYREALRGKSAQQLKDLETDARARGLGTQLNAILAERTRRTGIQAAADRKAAQVAAQHAQTVTTLTRSTTQLNERFALQVQQGKVTAEGLQRYRQALDGVRAKVALLPPALRASVTALITQGQTLATQGQGIVTHRTEIEKLRGEIDRWSLAELENARARVVAAGGDRDKLALIDAEIRKHQQLTDAQVAQARTESQLNAAQSGQETAEGDYEGRKSRARGNLAELYQIELQFGSRVQAARDAAARAGAADEERQIRERYGKLTALEGLTAERRRQLDADLARDLQANSNRLTLALGKNAQDRADAELEAKTTLDQALLTADRDTRDRLRKAALDDLAARTADVEAEQQAELDNEALTETQKLEVRKRFLPLLLAAKRAEVDQSRVIEQQAENDRYADAVEAARQQGLLDEKRLQPDGTVLTVAQEMERAHQRVLLGIQASFTRQYRDYELTAKRETGKQVLAADRETSAGLKEEAQTRVQDLTSTLDDQNAAQRAAARMTLQTWRGAYAAMGAVGTAAVAEIDAALARLDQVGVKARRSAAALVVPDGTTAQTDFTRKLTGIGKAEDSTDARAKAEGQYDELITATKTKLTELDNALATFAEKRDDQLTPDEVNTRDGLRATLALYQGFLTQAQGAASSAGTAAATAFTRAQQDQAADSALALVEAQKALADAEGRDGSPAYLAGLQAALAYWRARLTGLAVGTPEYLDALKKITDLEGKVTTAGSDPLQGRLQALAQVVSGSGTLGKTIAAGLDGLGAYFKAGGAKGGKTSVIAGAQALVAGLAGVFKTGDEDVDQALTTFVSGLQATLGQLAKGDWIGALIAGVATIVTTLIDLFQGGANSARKAAEKIADVTKGIKFFDLSGYAKTVSRGGLLGLFGFKTTQIDQDAVDFARSFGDALYDAISGGMLDGIRAGKTSFDALGLDLKKSLAQSILQGLIDGFVQGEIMKNLIQPFLDRFIAARKTADSADDVQAASDLQQAIITGNRELANFYETVLVPTSRELGVFGSDATSAGVGSAGPATIGGDATVQLGIAQIQFAENGRVAIDTLATAAPVLLAAGQALQLGVGEFRAAIASAGTTGAPRFSGLDGALTGG